jgi:hypothetical protein
MKMQQWHSCVIQRHSAGNMHDAAGCQSHQDLELLCQGPKAY